MGELLDRAVAHYPFLEEPAETVPEYAEFAVRLRSDDMPWITEEETRQAYKVVKALRGGG